MKLREKKSVKMYGGKVTVDFYPDSHSYWVDGKRVTGVTTYLGIIDKSRALVPWAVELYRNHLIANIGSLTMRHIEEGAKLHTVKKEEAATIGSHVHKWIEGYIKKESPEMPEQKEAQIGVNAFLDWVSANKVKFISSERIIYSRKYGYVGTMDIEAKVNGELCLIDIKTSNNIYNSYYLQTAAYVRADEEERKVKYDGRWVLRLAKETEEEFTKRMAEKGRVATYLPFEAKFLDSDKGNLKRDFDGFLACKSLYEWNKLTDPWLNKATA